MKTTATAINRVYSILSNAVEDAVYKGENPTIENIPSQYYTINSLPIGADIVQSCIVNVNYHVKDIGPGMADFEKIEAAQDAVIAVFPNDSTLDGIYITYDRDNFENTYPDKEKGEHYSNMRLRVTILNK